MTEKKSQLNRGRLCLFTTLAMFAFAGNSIICRIALLETSIDPASFTLVRLVSGALVLWSIISLRRPSAKHQGSWFSAFALFAYAALFSYAYLDLDAGTGALILFTAVQVSMVGFGLFKGEQLSIVQWIGLIMALAGLVGLLLPGISAPPLHAAILMAGSGIAWGAYSIRGKGDTDPALASAGNFLLTVPLALGLAILAVIYHGLSINLAGLVLALASGSFASAAGYLAWYAILPELSTTTAAAIQLSVPVLTAIGGVLLLSESLSLRLVLASVAIIGGVALVIRQRHSSEMH